MNLDRLALFVEIVDSGSISAASRRVHLTQPAVSRSLKVLEEEIGALLFERRGRGLQLTATGRALLPKARALLKQAEQLQRDIQRRVERGYFDLRLGAVNSALTYLLPEQLPPLQAAFPGLAIKLSGARTATLLSQLAKDALDMALIAYPGAPPAARSYRLGEYAMQYWGHAERFADLVDVRDEETLSKDYPLIEIESLPGQPTLIPEHATTFATTTSLAAVKALVLAGFGVGALVRFMLSAEEQATLVHARVPHDPDCAIYLVGSPHRCDDHTLEIEQALSESLRQRLTR